MPALEMLVNDRRTFLPGVVPVTPMNKRKNCGIELVPLVGKAVIVSGGSYLICATHQDFLLYKQRQALAKDAARNLQASLEVLEPPNTQEGVPQHQKRPAIADDGECACERAIFSVKFVPSHCATLTFASSYFKTY